MFSLSIHMLMKIACFHVLGIISNALLDTDLIIRYISRNGIAGS